MLCTIQGDVWRVEGLDDTLQNVRWRRYASGLHQALGLVVAEGKVLCPGPGPDHPARTTSTATARPTSTNASATPYETSPAGHDFICGLQRDAAGRFYTASGKQGLLRISADGRSVEVIATGFRNPDGLGLAPDGTIIGPGFRGRMDARVDGLRDPARRPLRLPRPAQRRCRPTCRWSTSRAGWITRARPRSRFQTTGSVRSGARCSTSRSAAGTYFLLLREKVGGQPQGAAVPMPGEFLSGVHRGRFNPKDGQLYVSGMTGWGTYTPLDGCFQRVRYTGEPVQLPLEFHAHENGVLLRFSRPLDRAIAERPERHFAQAWNYRYSSGYGSPELSPSHPGQPGHDALAIRSAHVLADGRTLFLEIPELQPVNQLHLHLRPDGGPPLNLFATVHRLAPPFTGFPGYQPGREDDRRPPDPRRHGGSVAPAEAEPLARENSGRTHSHHRGRQEPELLGPSRSRSEPASRSGSRFLNPDVVPHNWALIKPGTLNRVGDLVNKIIAEPDAGSRHYIPRTDDVLVYTDIVGPQDQFAISFRAPTTPGTISLPLHVPRALDGHERRDDRRVDWFRAVSHGIANNISMRTASERLSFAELGSERRRGWPQGDQA